MYLCIYLGSFFDILHAKSLQRKNHLLIPLQTKSILILDLNFVQKFQIISIRLPTLLILQTICVHLQIFLSNFQRKLTLHFFPKSFTKKKRNNFFALNVSIKEILLTLVWINNGNVDILEIVFSTLPKLKFKGRLGEVSNFYYRL